MRAWIGILSVLLGAFAAAPALAQPAPSLDIQRWHLVGSYHNFVLVHDGVIQPKMQFGADVTLNYALRPLQRTSNELGRVEGIVEHLLAGHARGAFAPTDWVEIDLGLGFFQIADAQPSIEELGGKQQVFSLGDIWLEGRFRPLREEKHFVTMGVIPFVTFPIGNRNLFLTAGLPTLGAKVALSKRLKSVHFAGHLGYRLVPNSVVVGSNVAADDEILYALGAGVTPILDKLDVNFELHGVGVVGPGRAKIGLPVGKDQVHSPLEWLVDARVRLPKNFDLIAGAGAGITAGVGSPSLRAFVGFSWAPPGDRDGDGLNDPVDSCPTVPEDVDGFEDADGCPDPDNDSDGLADADDACPDAAEDADGFEDADGCPDPDNDDDGLVDPMDRCPLEPEDHDGFEDEDGCIDPDNDGDGILDGVDQCPDDAETFDGWADEDGCPDPDNDNDGLLDEDDLCPDEPEVINGVKDDDGCPDDKLAVKQGEKIVILEKVLFVVNRDTILKRSYPVLEAVKQTLLDTPTIKRIRVEGHTDDQGSDKYNQRLSEKRANAVMRYLMDAGVDASRLGAVGYGESRPIDTNKTDEGRERNRRVEFTIVEQD